MYVPSLYLHNNLSEGYYYYPLFANGRTEAERRGGLLWCEPRSSDPRAQGDLLLRVVTEGGWLMLFPLGKRMGTICWLIKARFPCSWKKSLSE